MRFREAVSVVKAPTAIALKAIVKPHFRPAARLVNWEKLTDTLPKISMSRKLAPIEHRQLEGQQRQSRSGRTWARSVMD
jgi:hypothetical protein